MITLKLTFISIMLLQRVQSSCMPQMDLQHLRTEALRLGVRAGIMKISLDRYKNIEEIPLVKKITEKIDAFTTKFTGYTIDPTLFRLSHNWGLHYILMNWLYRTEGKGLIDASKHCRWMGGQLFQRDHSRSSNI